MSPRDVLQPKNYGYKHGQLYLEYVENKAKVLKTERIKPYIPPEVSLEYIAFQNNPNLFDSPYHSPYNSPYNSPSKRKYDESTDDDPNKKRLDELTRENNKNINNSFNSSRDRFNPPLTKIVNEEEDLAAKNRQNEIDEINTKRKYLGKFNMIGKMYPNATIPLMTMASDLEYMKNEYESLIKSLRLNEKNERYKQILIILFYIIEYGCGKFLKLDMNGYARSQIDSMASYQRLLIEIGEKHYIPNAPERITVELRLLGLIIIQTVIFIIMQKITSKLGNSTGIMAMVANIFGSQPSFDANKKPDNSKSEKTKSNESEKAPKNQAKMKGPVVISPESDGE